MAASWLADTISWVSWHPSSEVGVGPAYAATGTSWRCLPSTPNWYSAQSTGVAWLTSTSTISNFPSTLWALPVGTTRWTHGVPSGRAISPCDALHRSLAVITGAVPGANKKYWLA